MNAETVVPTYHVLLIGIDRYPPGYNSLWGCVNDIEAIEKLLIEQPGIGLPLEQIRITRLAAPHPEQPSTSLFAAQTLWPTKENLLAALKSLAGPDVKKPDRVLIYYSGHGDEIQWTGSSVWHEALVPHDGQKIEYLFDVEVNTLVNCISAKTDDLTIILDCCHSAGATRDLEGIEPEGSLRFLQRPDAPAEAPDLTKLGLESRTGLERFVSSGMLHAPAPDYLLVVACQSDERAGEGAYPGKQPPHGVFTHSLLSLLKGKDALQRSQLRWADIWPELLARVAERNEQLRQRTQHPWLIGRSERRVFGGVWVKMDAGYRVTQRSAGEYEIGAGKLMGVTEWAEVAVYGPEPPLFPSIESIQDQPVGRLQVTKAGPSSAVAIPIGAPFMLPGGGRGRLVKPGAGERLRVSLKPEDATLKAQLAASPLLEIVPSTAPNATVEVLARPGGGWLIGSDVEPVIAAVPVGEVNALQAGLEHYYRYNTVLRLARICSEPQISKCLSVRLLDCNDATKLRAMAPQALADPDLPEAPHDSQGIYRLPPGFKFCVRIENSSSYHLYVTLLNCSAAGLVEYLSDAVLRDGAAHVMWLDGQLGQVFVAGLDTLPTDDAGISRPNFNTERMIVIGTTRPDVDLQHLTVNKRVQEMVDENISNMRGGVRTLRPVEEAAAPAELWTATVTPIRIPR